KGQRRPEQAEQDKGDHAQQGADAQHRFFHEQAQHRLQQSGIAQPRIVLVARQRTAQRPGTGHHGDRGQRVDSTPVEQRGDPPRYGARQQDPQQQAAHHGADGAAAQLGGGQGGGQGNQHLRHDRDETGDGGSRQQQRQRGGHGAERQADAGQQHQ